MSNEFKETETTGKYISSKYDYDLYNEEDNKKMPLVRVQRYFSKKTNEESWRFFENTKKTIEISAELLNKEEISFLRSAEGILFCLKKYKENKDLNFIKNSISNFINSKGK